MLERLRDIPRNDPNHIVFVHVDMPEKSAVGSKLETVHYMEREFKYIVGFRAKYSENCTWVWRCVWRYTVRWRLILHFQHLKPFAFALSRNPQ